MLTRAVDNFIGIFLCPNDRITISNTFNLEEISGGN